MEARTLASFPEAERDAWQRAGAADAVLLRTSSGATRRGVEALGALLDRGGRTRLAALLAWPPVRAAAEGLYRLVARQRRILAPPERGVACACTPTPATQGDRLAFAMLWPLAFTVAVAVRATSARRSGRTRPLHPRS